MIQDSKGNYAELRVENSEILNTAHTSHGFSFRLKPTTLMPVYLRLRVGRPFATDVRIFVDEMALVKGTQLYAGGPYMAVFTGATQSQVDDGWTLTTTNNRAGDWQTWFDRLFDMSGKGLLLPSSGITNIPDALIG